MLKAGVAHLWFVTIHPFDDGNGRIARAIADHGAGALGKKRATLLQHVGANPAGAQGLLRHPGSDAERRSRHHALAGMVSRLPRSRVRRRGDHTRVRAEQSPLLGERTPATSFNERQRLILNRLLDGFEGKLTSSKWAKLAKCSQDTALRDIDNLVERGILVEGRRQAAAAPAIPSPRTSASGET